jgi:hypothetical protein
MVTLDDIRKIIQEHEGVNGKDIIKKTRKREIVFARQCEMYFAREFNLGSLAEVGSIFGDKDHATVTHAVKTINNLIDSDKNIRAKIFNYRSKITSLASLRDLKTKFNDDTLSIELSIKSLESSLEKLKADFEQIKNYYSILNSDI